MPDDLQLSNGIQSLVEVLSQMKPPKMILIVPPIYLSTPVWFVDIMPMTLGKLDSATKIGKRFSLLPEFKFTGVDLIDDGVHFDPRDFSSTLSAMAKM
jgi:hypothetical protein